MSRRHLDVSYRVERVSEVEADLLEIIPAHWEETGHGSGTARVDFQVYRELEKQQRCCIHTARDRKGKLVGYSFCFVADHHHNGVKYASNDCIYVIPARRGGEIMSRLIEYERLYVRCLGARKHLVSMRLHRRFSAALSKLGYTPYELVMAQELR